MDQKFSNILQEAFVQKLSLVQWVRKKRCKRRIYGWDARGEYMDGMSLCCCQNPVREAGEEGHSGRRDKGTRESLSSAKGPFKVYLPGTAENKELICC